MTPEEFQHKMQGYQDRARAIGLGLAQVIHGRMTDDVRRAGVLQGGLDAAKIQGSLDITPAIDFVSFDPVASAVALYVAQTPEYEAKMDGTIDHISGRIDRDRVAPVGADLIIAVYRRRNGVVAEVTNAGSRLIIVAGALEGFRMGSQMPSPPIAVQAGDRYYAGALQVGSTTAGGHWTLDMAINASIRRGPRQRASA